MIIFRLIDPGLKFSREENAWESTERDFLANRAGPSRTRDGQSVQFAFLGLRTHCELWLGQFLRMDYRGLIKNGVYRGLIKFLKITPTIFHMSCA